MARVVDVVTQYVLEERQPAVAMMWLSEPDVSQHAHGVGSPEALNAIGEADRQFGRLLDWLEQDGESRRNRRDRCLRPRLLHDH